MVQWLLSNSGTLLEKIRNLLGGTERPNQLYYYTGVMPTVDVTSFTGVVKQSGVNSSSPVVGFNSIVLKALNFPGLLIDGRVYRLLNVTAYTAVLGTSITVRGAFYTLRASGEGSVVGQVNVNNTATVAAFTDQVGGDLNQPVLFTAGDPNALVGFWLTAVNNTSANTMNTEIVVQELGPSS